MAHLRAVRHLLARHQGSPLNVEETRMSRSTVLMRPIAGAALVLWGLAGPAWATYGGGACHRCAPAPVIQTTCNVVPLVPQYQTVYQTVYETVYENQPYTVMETRYRQAYQTENYTVMRPVLETTQVARKYTVMRPVYQTVNQERRYTVCRPVYQTQRLERRYTVMRPVHQTVHQERRYTVTRPVVQTTMVSQPYTVCRPVTTVRQVVEECGYYETQAVTVPGPVIEQPVCAPIEPCGCGRRGLFGCGHRRQAVAVATVAVQCPPRVVCQSVYVPRQVVRNISETQYVT